MTKITPYTALCDIFRSKERNSDDDAETSTKKEEEEKTPAKTVQKINNSCQTHTLQDNCFEKILKSQKKQPSLHANIKFHDDNFQILRADYCTYSKPKEIHHVAEKPEECEENFTRKRKRRRLSPSNFIKKILSRDPSPNKPKMKDGATSTDEEEVKNKDSIQNEENKPKSEKDDIYPPLRFNYPETSKTPLPKLNYKGSKTKSTPSTRAAKIEHKVNTLYRTLSGLKQTFQKKYHFEATQFTEKCLCRHCGALAVVKESLKSPMIFDSNEETDERPIQRKKKRLDEKEYFKLSIKLKILEDRLRELEELTYIHKSGTGLRHDMYTQCQGKNNFKGSDHKTCGLSFFLPPNIKQKMFGKKTNPNESGSHILESDFEIWKEKRGCKNKRKKTARKPKLRCHDYVNNRKDNTEKSTSLGFKNTNVQVVECKESQKEVNSNDNEISILQKELSNINHHQITEILMQLLKNKSRISEGKVVRFELNSNNTNLQYESGVLYNSSVLPNSLVAMLNDTKKDNSSELTNYELNPEEGDTKILYNRGKAFISNSRQNLTDKNDKSQDSSNSNGDSEKKNCSYNESDMIKKLILESNKNILRSELYKEKQKSKTNIDDTNCMPVKKFEEIQETKEKNQENIRPPEKRIKSQIPRRYVFTSSNKQEQDQKNNTNINKNLYQSKLNSIFMEKDNFNKQTNKNYKYPNTKIPTRDRSRSRSHSETNPNNFYSETINMESPMYQTHLSRKTDFENRSKQQLPKKISVKFNKKSIMKSTFDKKSFQEKFFTKNELQEQASPIRISREKTENYHIRRKCYFPDVHQYVNKNYKDSSGTSCTGGTTSTIYNIAFQRRSRSFSTSYAKIHSMRVNFKEEKPATVPKRKCNVTLPSNRSPSQNSGRSESPTKKQPTKNFIKINKEKCTQLSKLKYEQKIAKILEKKRCESEKSGKSSWKSSQENVTTFSTRSTTRNNSEKDLTVTSNNNSETTDTFFGVIKKYSKQFLHQKPKTTKKCKKSNKKNRYIGKSSELKIIRISRIPVIADDKYRRKSRSPRKLKKSHEKHSTKYQLVFKATPKFDKGCFCRPNMIDRSTTLSGKQIPTKKPCNKVQETDKKLSMKTMILNNIESMQQNYEQSLNKIIILNHPHYGEVPAEIDKCTTSTNTLNMQTNTLKNLVPSYIHNDFRRNLKKNSKIKTSENSSKETNKEQSPNFDKTQDLETKKKSSIFKMFKKNNYDVQKINYQVFVSPKKSKSRQIKRQTWDIPDQSRSIDDVDERYGISNPFQNPEDMTYNNVPHSCNLSNRQRCCEEDVPCCSNWSPHVHQCNECPDKSKCGTNKTIGDTIAGIKTRIKSAINVECSCDKQKQKPVEIKTEQKSERYEMPMEQFPKVESIISKEEKPEISTRISKIPIRKKTNFKIELEEKISKVPSYLSEEQIFPTEPEGKSESEESVNDPDNKIFYGCDCLTNTIRSKCKKCKQKHIEELRKNIIYDDFDDDESISYRHSSLKKSLDNFRNSKLLSTFSRKSKKSIKSFGQQQQNKTNDKNTLDSATGNILKNMLRRKSERQSTVYSDDSKYSLIDDSRKSTIKKKSKFFSKFEKKSSDESDSSDEDLSHYDLKKKKSSKEKLNTSQHPRNTQNYNDIKKNKGTFAQEYYDFLKQYPSSKKESLDKETVSETVEVLPKGPKLTANIYEKYTSVDRELNYLKDSEASITPLRSDSRKTEKTIPYYSYNDPKPDETAQLPNKTIPHSSYNSPKSDETNLKSNKSVHLPHKSMTPHSFPLPKAHYSHHSVKPAETETIPHYSYHTAKPDETVKIPHDSYHSPEPDETITIPHYSYRSPKPDETVTIPHYSYHFPKPDETVTIPHYSYHSPKPDETVTIPHYSYHSPKPDETVQCPNKPKTPHYLSDQCTIVGDDLEDCFYKCQAALQSKKLEEEIEERSSYNETKSYKYDSTICEQESPISNKSSKCIPKTKDKPKKKYSFFRKKCDKECGLKSDSINSIEKENKVIRLTEEHSCPEKCTFNTEEHEEYQTEGQFSSEHKTYMRPIDSDGPCVPMSPSCMFKFEDPDCSKTMQKKSEHKTCLRPIDSDGPWVPMNPSFMFKSEDPGCSKSVQKKSEHKTCLKPTDSDGPMSSSCMSNFEDPEPCPARPSRNACNSAFQTSGYSGSTCKSTNCEPEPKTQLPSKYSYEPSPPTEPYMNPYMYPPEMFVPPQCMQNCPYMYAPAKPVTHEMSTQSEIFLQENLNKNEIIQHESDNIEDENDNIDIEDELDLVQTISEDRILVPSKNIISSKINDEPTERIIEARPVKQKRNFFGFKRKRKNAPSVTPSASHTSISKQKGGIQKCEFESITSFSIGVPRRRHKTGLGKCEFCENESVTSTNKKNKRQMGKVCGRKCVTEENVSRRKSSLKKVKSVTINVPLDESSCNANESCIKSKCSRYSAESHTGLSAKNSGSCSKFTKSVKDSVQLITKCSLCDACRDKVQSDNDFEPGLKTCLLPMCTRVKDKITSTFPCKYFKNFTKKSDTCHPSCEARPKKNYMNNTYQVNNVECNQGYFGDYDNRQQTLEASSMNTSILNLYYNVQSFYFENEDDWDWSYSEDDVILTADEKKRYLLDKLHLLHNFQDQINNSSNYGAFE